MGLAYSFLLSMITAFILSFVKVPKFLNFTLSGLVISLVYISYNYQWPAYEIVIKIFYFILVLSSLMGSFMGIIAYEFYVHRKKKSEQIIQSTNKDKKNIGTDENKTEDIFHFVMLCTSYNLPRASLLVKYLN